RPGERDEEPGGRRPPAGADEAPRALAIIRLAALDADAATQAGAGNSAIIVPPVTGSAITRWMSRSGSIFAASSLARTRLGRRLDAGLAGRRSRRSALIVVVRGLRFTSRALRSASVFTAHRSTPQARRVAASLEGPLR